MALRAGYQGFKKLLPGLKLFRPGCLGIDNTEVSKTFFPRSEQAVTGAVNLCPMKIASGTPSGLTITAAADGTFSVSGTASGTDNYGRTTFTLNKGTYYLSGVTGGGSASSPKYELHLKIGASDVMCYDGFTEFTIANDNTEFYIEFIYRSGAVIDTVVKPMISLASDIPYVPYAMTNKELTDQFPTKYTSTGLTVTNGTISEGGYCKIGNVVLVNIRLQAAETGSAVDILGLPLYSGANKVICSGANFSDDVSAYAYITSGGHLFIKASDVIADKNYVVSGMYLAI